MLYHTITKARKFYRLEDKNTTSDLFSEGNKFTIDGRYSSNVEKFYYSYTGVLRGKTLYAYEDEIHEFLKKKHKKKEIIKYLEELKEVAIRARDKRMEFLLSLELHNTYGPQCNRRNSLIVTDEKSLPYWNQKLNSDDSRDIYELSCKGVYVKTRDSLLPDPYISGEEMKRAAKIYFENINRYAAHGVNDYEYLFQGDVEVLGKVKL